MFDQTMVLSKSRFFKAAAALALALVLAVSVFCPVTAKADGGLTLSTPYPGITVSLGDNVSFALTVKNDTASPQNVALSVAVPEGWEAYFEGDGNPVSRVYVDAAGSDNSAVTVDLVVKMPDKVAEGVNTLTATATGEGGAADTLQLDVTVSQEEYTKGKMTTPFQEQQSSSTSIFDYTITLTNGNNKAQSYSLSAAAGDGWQVSFYTSDGVQVTNINLESNRNTTITVKADPPTDIAAGSYPIQVSAASPNETLSVDLVAVITGTYAMTLTTPTGNLNIDAIAGKESTITLTVENTGTADLSNIALTASSVPSDWSVDFDTKEIATLPAGQSVQVNATIKPATDAINGDYVVNIKAQTSEATTTTGFRVTIKTSTVWGIVGLLIVAAVVVALILIFRKFGRR